MALLCCRCHCEGCPRATPSLPPAGTINTPPWGLKITPCPLLAVIGNLAAPNPVVSAFLCPSLSLIWNSSLLLSPAAVTCEPGRVSRLTKLRVAPDPTPGMLSRGCTGTIPPAFVTRAGAGLVPSAGTRREGLTCAKIRQALGSGFLFIFFFLGVSRRLWDLPWCPIAGSCSAVGGRGASFALGMLPWDAPGAGEAVGSLSPWPGREHPAAAPSQRGRRRMLSSPRAGQAPRAPLSCVTPTEAPVTHCSQAFSHPGPGGTQTFNSPNSCRTHPAVVTLTLDSLAHSCSKSQGTHELLQAEILQNLFHICCSCSVLPFCLQPVHFISPHPG